MSAIGNSSRHNHRDPRYAIDVTDGEDDSYALLQLRLPCRDLTRVAIELLSWLIQRPLACDCRKRRVRLERW